MCMDKKEFLLKIDDDVWNKYIETLPTTITPTKHITNLIINHVREYQRAKNGKVTL